MIDGTGYLGCLVFLFGRFRFSIENCEEKDFSASNSWTEYLADGDAGHRLIVQKNDTPWESFDESSRWIREIDETTTRILFQSGKSELFSISYGMDGRDFTVASEHSGKALLRAIQFALMTAWADRALGIHAVTVLVGDQAILLSAHSGTGKSTLARLLHRYCEAATVNGDFALVSVDTTEGAYFEPTPFCGSSGICKNHRFSIDRIVFLEQAKENEWRDLRPNEGYARLLENLFVPDFDEKRCGQVLENAMKLIERVPASIFRFRPDEDAAKLFYDSVSRRQQQD